MFPSVFKCRTSTLMFLLHLTLFWIYISCRAFQKISQMTYISTSKAIVWLLYFSFLYFSPKWSFISLPLVYCTDFKTLWNLTRGGNVQFLSLFLINSEVLQRGKLSSSGIFFFCPVVRSQICLSAMPQQLFETL